MKFIENPETISHQSPVARIRFAFWDVAKMLGTAVLCGLAFSIAAAGLTLLLSANADAGEMRGADGDRAQGAPGTLLNSTAGRRNAPEHSRGSVWVEWGNRKPAYIIEFPHDAALERVNNVIAGLSWDSPALQPGEKFRLAWTMQ